MDPATTPDTSDESPPKPPDRRLFWVCSSVGFGCAIAWLIAARRGNESGLILLWLGSACAFAVGFYSLYRGDRYFLPQLRPRTNKAVWKGGFAWWGLIFKPPTAEERSPVACTADRPRPTPASRGPAGLVDDRLQHDV
jgi:hypothetical protein